MLVRGVVTFIGLCCLWQLVILLGHLPPYILPSPIQVMKAWVSSSSVIATEALPTIIETLLGLSLGILVGVIAALNLLICRPIRRWLMPILLISQALPTFAIAPLLVVWFGYGMASKIITTMIMLFFPITNACYDGLRQTPPDWLDLAAVMNISRWRTLCGIQIPAALPSLASGIRIATAIAPVGAIIGEWVGSSQGLGYLMLNANARMQIDMMFATLLTIILLTLLLYYSVDKLLSIAIPWQRQGSRTLV